MRDLLPPVAAMIGMTQKTTDENLDQSGLLGKYQLMAKLGEGGMGWVHGDAHGVPKDHGAGSCCKTTQSNRLERRRAIFSNGKCSVGPPVKRKHSPRIEYSGEEATAFILVMEYIDGCDLSRLVRNRTRSPLNPDAAKIIERTAQGLEFAHRNGLVHRDVKPFEHHEFIVHSDRENPQPGTGAVAQRISTLPISPI